MGRIAIDTIVRREKWNGMKIEYLISISGSILMVYRTSEEDYQYEIILWDGSIYQPEELYAKAGQAKLMGIESIKTVIGY